MTTRLCRWGILGTAGIARKNWHSIRNSGNGTLVAVASREPQRAESFIRECQAHVPFAEAPGASSYDALLRNPQIDAVYVPLPTALRKDWVVRAARAGKHVVCEKPCGVCAADVAEMLAACREHNVQFMDGVMFFHSRRMDRLREVLNDSVSIGGRRRITSHFCFFGGDEFLQQNIRANGQLEPLGCLGDLGWYNLCFTLWTQNYERPERVSGRMLSSVPAQGGGFPVPLEFSGELFFASGTSAAFYCSFVTELQQWAEIAGTKGHLRLRDFVLPYYGSEVGFDVGNDRFAIEGCQFNMEEHTRRVAVREYSNNAPSAQESNLFRCLGEIALTGQLVPRWGEQALLTQQVLDACLDSARRGGELLELSR